jgi:hypothetical protein
MADEHVSVQGKKRTMYFERASPNPVNYYFQLHPVPPHWQKHHILPCTSVRNSIATAAGEAGKEHLVKALKYFTNWNINQKPNLMGMPTRTAYHKAYGKKGGRTVPLVVPGNLPCHQPTNWGHTNYNDQVDLSLLSIWSKVVIKVEDHKLSANDIATDIEGAVNTWKGKFPGTRQATIENWRKMMQGHPGAHNNFTMVRMAASPV